MTVHAYVHTKETRPNGSLDCLATCAVDAKRVPLWWHKQGLTYTRTGYGARIPTEWMVRFNGRWRRVYCAIFSNSGTLYIGKRLGGAYSLIVSIEEG